MPKIVNGGKVLTSETVISEVLYNNETMKADEKIRKANEVVRETQEIARQTNTSNAVTRANLAAKSCEDIASGIIQLPDIGTAGTYNKVNTDAKGRVTSASLETTIGGLGITDVYTKTQIDTKTGDLANLQTTSNTDLVGAINENKDSIDTISVIAKKTTDSTDDTVDFILDTGVALNGDATFLTTENEEYLITGNLHTLAEPVVPIGKGKITSSNHNNRYFNVFNPRTASGILPSINPSYRFENISKFAKALTTAKSGGSKVKVTFVGDSLTQAGHRASDNYYWCKQLQNKLIESYGDCFTFYNRGFAGTTIAVLNNVLSSPLNAPFEANWVTESGTKTWLQYIEDTSPDLIISAFGINSTTGNVYKDLLDGRTKLKSISSNPDIVWVTTPIRTINTEATYNSNSFGTYPDNEYSNTTGIMTRLFAQKYGDAVIDVNRNMSIAMLGIDPYQYCLNRWFGLYRTTDNKFIAPEGTIMGGGDEQVTMTINNLANIQSNKLFRNVSMEFTPTGNLNSLRIWIRRDTKSDSHTLISLANTEIIYYGIWDIAGSTGGVASWTGDCRNKRVRIEVVGTIVRVYVDGLKAIEVLTNIGSQMLAPISFQALGDTDCILNDIFINEDIYKSYMPRISSNEVFNVSYGDGGNGLNHPNVKGEMELYGQVIDEFVASLSNVEYLASLNTSGTTVGGSVPLTVGATGTLYYVKRNNIVTLHFNNLSGVFGNAEILVTLPSDLRPTSAARTVLSRTGTGEQSILTVDIRDNGNIYVYNAPIEGVEYSGSIVFITG